MTKQVISKQGNTAISPTRKENFPEWYQEIIKAASLAENSSVRGCMVIKPWGYGIWENIQQVLDQKIKDTGHENAYFPIFIPISHLEKEATHVEGFAKECAVVTHHRLELIDGKLVPTGELEEPLIVRPTSETIIGESFANWVQSYRDLPILINQWANVVRWEMRPRLFLRTVEFLWQEGHTCHATAEEAMEETIKMHLVYKDLLENTLALAGIAGEKPYFERFPGADNTYTFEAMMQDGKALQASTSHYLSQNFAKAFNIRFLNKEGNSEFAYTTSWGSSTRMIGGLIMTHGDDDGLRLPPKVAPKHVAILPIAPKPESEASVHAFCKLIEDKISCLNYNNKKVIVTTDKRDIRGGDKTWQWIKKGIPIRIEIGQREVEANKVCIYRRDKPHKERLEVGVDQIDAVILQILNEMQDNYYNIAKSNLENNTEKSLKSPEDLKEYFQDNHDNNNKEDQSENRSFVLGKWCGTDENLEKLADLKISIRCIPEKQSGTTGKCLLSGKEAITDVIYARSY